MNRILTREFFDEPRYESERRKVGVLGMAPGAGATFVSLCLARAMADTKDHNVTVIELNGGSIYDSMALDKRFSGKEFFLFNEAIVKGESIKGQMNFDEGINWAVWPRERIEENFDTIHKLRIINNIYGNMLICDFSGEQWGYDNTSKGSMEKRKSNLRLLEDMDHIIFVIDPMPSKMLRGYYLLNDIKSLWEKVPVTYVLNKYNDGINVKDMVDFLKVKKFVSFPAINCEALYKAEYNCKAPYSQREVRSKISEPINALYKNVIKL